MIDIYINCTCNCIYRCGIDWFCWLLVVSIDCVFVDDDDDVVVIVCRLFFCVSNQKKMESEILGVRPCVSQKEE